MRGLRAFSLSSPLFKPGPDIIYEFCRRHFLEQVGVLGAEAPHQADSFYLDVINASLSGKNVHSVIHAELLLYLGDHRRDKIKRTAITFASKILPDEFDLLVSIILKFIKINIAHQIREHGGKFLFFLRTEIIPVMTGYFLGHQVKIKKTVDDFPDPGFFNGGSVIRSDRKSTR